MGERRKEEMEARGREEGERPRGRREGRAGREREGGGREGRERGGGGEGGRELTCATCTIMFMIFMKENVLWESQV